MRRDFISNISHELRTPLASLKALVETLRDSALDDPPAARRFLDRADQEVDALTQMVQEILELSRIESGKVPLRLSPTPVADVISNLVHNAVKFTPEGGKISVRAKRSDEGMSVVISVTDNGVGIPAGELDRIFERFYKADRARSGGGTGLGLAISRHLVQAQGGRIWAKSKEGKGSTFYFTLPIAGVDEPEQGADSGSELAASRP